MPYINDIQAEQEDLNGSKKNYKKLNREENSDFQKIGHYKRKTPVLAIILTVLSVILLVALIFVFVYVFNKEGYVWITLVPFLFMVLSAILVIVAIGGLVVSIQNSYKDRVAFRYNNIKDEIYIYSARGKKIKTLKKEQVKLVRCETTYNHKTNSKNDYTGQVDIIQNLFIEFVDDSGIENQFTLQDLVDTQKAVDELNNLVKDNK